MHSRPLYQQQALNAPPPPLSQVTASLVTQITKFRKVVYGTARLPWPFSPRDAVSLRVLFFSSYICCCNRLCWPMGLTCSTRIPCWFSCETSHRATSTQVSSLPPSLLTHASNVNVLGLYPTVFALSPSLPLSLFL